jgi:XTP/dITP diphosphohydrolase
MQYAIATNNPFKRQQLNAAIQSLGLDLTEAVDMEVPDVEEIYDTLYENALLKLTSFRQRHPNFDGFVFSDDSGLFVEALGDAPGVISARYSGQGDKANMALLVENLKKSGAPKPWRARFVSVVYCWRANVGYHRGEVTVYGEILDEPRNHGSQHGYDPIFSGDDYDPDQGAGATLRMRVIKHTCIFDVIRTSLYRQKHHLSAK